MRINSMTATFGKLNHDTLTFKPGLNVIEAPNEWGKSTWCAFILAMLYGIDTSSRSKKDFLPDKEHYAPWSGSPMSGRMDICWNGRNITIERSTKGRSIFGQFKAYETESGMEVPELTAANCGQQLLGVEQSVFARAGFIRLKDMPVTQDEALRKRLNALVTTGDESGSADVLAQKLKDVKNRCRFNRSGLLPQAELQQRELASKLDEMANLEVQMQTIEKRQGELKAYQAELLNHKQTLQYEDDRNFAGKLAMARAQLEIAQERVEALENVCADLPEPRMLELKRMQLQELLEKKEALQMEIQLQPPAPAMPEVLPQFRGMDPALAVDHVEADLEELRQLLEDRRKPSPALWIIGAVCSAVGIGLLLAMGIWYVLPVGFVLAVLGIVLQQNQRQRNRQLEAQAQMIARKYAPLERGRWVEEAKRYADTLQAYEAELNDYSLRMQQMNARLKAVLSQLEEVTGGMTISRYEQETDAAIGQHRAYGDALREHSRLKEMVATLESSHREVPPPAEPDQLTFTAEETERILSDVTAQIRQLHQQMGQCQGRMQTLGNAAVLREELAKVEARIEELETYYSAAVLAQELLIKAKQELQRRFAPRISQRAQEIFAALTGGRYQRIALAEDLSVSTAAEGEDIMRGCLWRSDGTADQMYLALRLAVAEELTPHAPLILDDAFVRFDDGRLKEALNILNQTGEDKQVILFTCQSRERNIMEE